MKRTIISITEIRGSMHEALGPKFKVILSDNTSIDKYWEELHMRYNPYDETVGKYGAYKVPVEEWKVNSVVGQEWNDNI
jgi:hypothetical protein